MLGVHDDRCSMSDTVQSSQFCWLYMMIDVACQILYSPVQSVLLAVHDDRCSVSDSVQSSTVSTAACA